jgi:hypothetical protein
MLSDLRGKPLHFGGMIMKIFAKAVLACGTAAILAVTPMSAMATNIDRHTAASGSNDVMHQAWDGHHRRWRHHDRIDGGDILTGIGILAGIAIIAGAASDADKRDRDEPRYDDRNDDRRDDRPIGQSAYQDNDLGTAVSACTDAAERSAGNGARVSEIRSVTRDGNGWRVEGDLSQDSFTCAATDGRVDYIRINDREI